MTRYPMADMNGLVYVAWNRKTERYDVSVLQSAMESESHDAIFYAPLRFALGRNAQHHLMQLECAILDCMSPIRYEPESDEDSIR